jgi:hypothetical protein
MFLLSVNVAVCLVTMLCYLALSSIQMESEFQKFVSFYRTSNVRLNTCMGGVQETSSEEYVCVVGKWMFFCLQECKIEG